MAHALKATISFADYLEMEQASRERHEYVAGEYYSMTGGSARHNRIAFNTARIFADRLEGTPCQVFINDMKLYVQAANCAYYPDVFVYCGSGVAADEMLVADAMLVVEVLSGNTSRTDRSEKLFAYRQLPGLRAHWMARQDEQRVEVHRRDAGGSFSVAVYGAGDTIPADPLDGPPSALASLYAGTDLA